MSKDLGMITIHMKLVVVIVLLFSACRKDDNNSKAVKLGQNKFTVNIDGSGSETHVFSILSSTTNIIDSSGSGSFDQIIIDMEGTTNPGNIQTSVQINLTNQVNESYPLQQPGNSVTILMAGADYISGSLLNSTSNNVIFTNYGAAGSFISGTYEFDFTGGTITNGEFWHSEAIEYDFCEFILTFKPIL